MLRVPGITELLADILLVCTGSGSGTVTTDIRLALNVDVWNRDFGSEAVLLIDEPVAPVPGVNFFRAEGTAGTSQRVVEFLGVPVTVPATGNTRTLRIVNLRADVSAINVAANVAPPEVSVSITAKAPVSITGSPQVGGYVVTPITTEMILPAGGVPAGNCAGRNQALVTNQAATGGVIDFAVRFNGKYTTAFKPRRASSGSQNVPGVSYYSESGYFDESLPTLGGLNRIGLADTGTRLVLRFTNIPAGQRIYVSTGAVEARDPARRSWIRLVNTGGSPVAPTTTASWTNTDGSLSADIAPLTATNGSATAEWEVTGNDPNQLASYSLGILVAHSGVTAVSTAQVTASLGVLAPSSQVPRFLDQAASRALPVSACVNGLDLVATSILKSGSALIIAGVSDQMQVGVMNRGLTPSGTLAYIFQLVDNAGKEKFRTTGSLPGLAAGESRENKIRFRVPVLTPTDVVTARFTVSSAAGIAEVSTENNVINSPAFYLYCGRAVAGNLAASAAGGNYSLPLVRLGSCSPTSLLPSFAQNQISSLEFPNTPFVSSIPNSALVKVEASSQGYQRTGQIYGPLFGYIPVEQASADPGCTFSLGSGDMSTAAPEGETRRLTIQTGTSCKWTAVSNTSMAAPTGDIFTGPKTFSLLIRPNFRSTTREIPVVAGDWSGSIVQAANSRPQTERIIQLIYYRFLGRMPSEAEISSQSALLTGKEVDEFLPGFFGSEEFNVKSRYIAGLYVGLLTRDAEFNGFVYQRDALLAGIVNAESLVTGFLNSPEWRLRFGSPDNAAFVRLLYQNVLLRAPSQSEVDGHAANLAKGQSRGQLASAFLNSPEFRAGTGKRLTANLLFAAVLGRDPAAAELSAMIGRLTSGQLWTEALSALVGSAEFGASID